jgi:xylulokinase
LWNDGRTAEETAWLNDTVGRPVLSARTGNIAFAAFTAPKLLWMKKHEPELFARIRKIMLPKDYLVYCLTGVHATDYSDASGTLLLDVEHKCWSRDMLALCGISESQMPRLYESFAPVGMLLPETAAALGLPQGVTVCAGAGDNAAAAVAPDGEHRSGPCGQQVQYLSGHFRHHFYFLGKVVAWTPPTACTALPMRTAAGI